MAVDLWGIQMERSLTPQETEFLFEILPAERRERLLRLRNRKYWREPLCAYGLLRLALLRTYGLLEIPTLTLGEQGKPEFSGHPSIHFSLTHTEGAVLIGLSDAPLGVDLEKLRPVSQRISTRLAATGETAEEYFRNWVRYEAAVKRRGESVSPHHRPDGTEDAWEVSVFSGYCSAVSGIGPVRTIHHCTIEDLTVDMKTE